MKHRGSINIDISFPVLIKTINSFSISQSKEKFTLSNNRYFNYIRKNNIIELIIDSSGNLFSKVKTKKNGYSNLLWGFNLASISSVFYAKVYLKHINFLSLDELKEIGREILKSNEEYFSDTTLYIKRWKNEFENLKNREDVLRYMFYFAGTSYYLDPDKNDTQWRKKIGFR